LEKTYRKRRSLMEEFESTEKHYVVTLSATDQQYQVPLSEIVTAAQDRQMFQYFPKLIEKHCVLLDQLQSALADWTDESCIGETLLKWIPSLRIYEQYVAALAPAQDVVAVLEKDPKVSVVLRECHIGAVYSGANGLLALLTTPIQRMMRYVIILKSLLKYTPDDHPDRSMVAKALEAVSVMADHINSTKEETDHARRLQAIDAHLVGDKQSLYDSVSELAGKHQFKSKSFRTPHWCGYCNTFLRGLKKQGVICKKCKFAAHAACAKKMPNNCGSEQSKPTLLKEGRDYVCEVTANFSQISLAPDAIFSEELKKKRRPLLVFLFTDAVMFAEAEAGSDEEKLAFIAIARFYSLRTNRLMEIVRSNATTITMKSARDDCSYSIEFDEELKCNSFFEVLTNTFNQWHSSQFRKSSSMREQLVSEGLLEEQSDTIVVPVPTESEIRFVIPSTARVPTSVKHKDDYYTAYIINIYRVDPETGAPVEETLLKRYSQLFSLNQKLKKIYKKLPKFPPKKWFNNTDSHVVQYRCKKLQNYLNELNKVPGVWTHPLLEQFFSTNVDEANSSSDEESHTSAGTLPSQPSSHLSGSLRVSTSSFGRRSTIIGMSFGGAEPAEREVGSDELSDSAHGTADQQQHQQHQQYDPQSAVRFSTTEPVCYVQALYDFEPQQDSELGFSQGEQLEIIDKTNDEWWYARVRGLTGYVPVNYLLLVGLNEA